MKYIFVLCFLLIGIGKVCFAQEAEKVVSNGIPWFDDHGNIVNAHGACIVEDGGRYYLFGEWKSDKSNAFPGFSCYSSIGKLTYNSQSTFVFTLKHGNDTIPMFMGDRWSYPASFKGTHVAIVGESNPHSGYAKVSVLNATNDTVYTSLVDFYSKYQEHAVRIMTPKMPEANCTLLVEVTGIKPVWTDKTKRIYGSDNTCVTIDDIYIYK